MVAGEDILKSFGLVCIPYQYCVVHHSIIVTSDLVRRYIAIARSGKTLRLKRTEWLGLVAVGTGNQCRMATD